MKAYLKIILFTLLLILLLGVKGAKAHDEFTRVIKKEFPINPDAQLTISNKFGEIHCSNWEKNNCPRSGSCRKDVRPDQHRVGFCFTCRGNSHYFDERKRRPPEREVLDRL
jgi:hypothetical protein